MKLISLTVILLAVAVLGAAPAAQAADFQVAEPSAAVFRAPFQGFGAEWDPFYFVENNQKRGADEAGWKLITQRIKDLDIHIVRMVMQLKWCQAEPNLTLWTWDTPQMKSLYRYLDFCQANDITVILTDWGWAARGKNLAGHNLYPTTSDPRYAHGMAAYLKELIVNRKYTCIRYFVAGNEPDYELIRDHGLAEYVKMYANLDAALREAGLGDKVKLMGPDMTGMEDDRKLAIDRINRYVGAYDFHRYAKAGEVSNAGVRSAADTLWTHLDKWRGEVDRRDPDGSNKWIMVTELGIQQSDSSKGGTFSNVDNDTFEYALNMADYGTTLLNCRIQAGLAWTLHDEYYFDTVFGKEFDTWLMQLGMWKYCDKKWELRPWGQSFGLLIKHAPQGSLQAAVNGTPPKTPAPSPYRCAAVKRPDGGWSIFLVNHAAKDEVLNVTLPEEPKRGYKKYVFDKQTPAQFPDTLVLPPVEQVGHLEKNIRLTIPGQTFVVLVETEVAQPQTSSQPASGSP
jgi:hypothetical protein